MSDRTSRPDPLLQAVAPGDNPDADVDGKVVDTDVERAAVSSIPTFDDASLMSALVAYDSRVEQELKAWHQHTTETVVEPLLEIAASASRAAENLLASFEAAVPPPAVLESGTTDDATTEDSDHDATSSETEHEEAPSSQEPPPEGASSDGATPKRRLTEALASEAEGLDLAASCRIQAIRYRRDSKRRVLAPILKHLETNAPAFQTANRFMALLHSLESAAGDVPDSARIVDREEAFAAEPADTLFMRAKKWNYRRRIRSSAGALSRPVPVQLLARYNSTVRLPDFLAPLHGELHQSLAQYVAGIERAIAEWATAILVIERPLDAYVRDRIAVGLLPLVRDVNKGTEAAVDTDNTDVSIADAGSNARERVKEVEDARATVIENVRSTTQKFVAAIAALSELQPVVPAPPPQAVNGATRVFRTDIRQYGTPFLDSSTRDLPAETPVAKARTLQSRWLQWNQQVCNRFALYDTTLTLRETMTDAERQILTDVTKLSVQPLNDIFERIKAVFSESAAITQQAADAASESKDLIELRRTIERVKSNNNRFLSRTLHDLPGMVSADEVLSDPGARHWPSVISLAQDSTATLTIHDLAEPGKPIVPGERIRTIALQERLGEAIQPVSKRFKTAAEPLRKSLQYIWSDVEKTKTSVLYNLDTASSELERIISGEDDLGPDGESEDAALDETERGIKRTTELVIKGYERAVAALDELLPRLREPWSEFSEIVIEEIQQQWLVAVRKVRPGAPDEPDWEGLSASASRTWHRVRTSMVETATEWWQQAQSLYVSGRRRLRKLIRIGQTAVGAIEASEEDLTRTLDEVERIVELRRELPLVYRHLFALEPLVEPALFEGRARDLAKIKDRLQRWTSGDRSGSIVLTAPVGSGRTTFLNMISSVILEDIPHVFVRPARRMDESELSELLAERVEVELPDDDHSFDSFEAAIIAKGVPDTPFVCLIDDFEHLFMRSPDGVDLVKRLLVLMSRTDTCIFWIAACGDLAWRYLTSVAGSVTTYPSVHPLTSITRDTLESVIMTRHKRSSIPMVFVESQAQTDAMRQWLTRSRSDRERQQFAQAQYFDRLFRYSGQNIMLALYYWIRTATFSEDGGSVEVQQLEPLKFETLSRYTMTQSFSLEAFLFHKTLSLKEHNEILRLENTEGSMLIEALMNARILVRVRATDEERDAATSGRILTDDRFRIRPLLLHPVRLALSQRHLVY